MTDAEYDALGALESKVDQLTSLLLATVKLQCATFARIDDPDSREFVAMIDEAVEILDDVGLLLHEGGEDK